MYNIFGGFSFHENTGNRKLLMSECKEV